MTNHHPGHIAFLTTPGAEHNDNHKRLPRYFTEAGWQVSTFPHDALNMRSGEVRLSEFPATSFDLIWVIGFGPRAGFLDRTAILRQLPQPQLVTPVEIWLSHHGKTVYPQFSPPSAVSADAEVLIRAQPDLRNNAESGLVLKPLAGSYGRDVIRVYSDDDIRQTLAEAPGYWMLQAYLEKVIEGEIRTLTCAGTVLGSYLRTPADGLHANLALGAEAKPAHPTGVAAQRIAQIHADLAARGVGFAAIDMVGDDLMEVNVANPGGLATLEIVYGQPLGPRVCEALAKRLNRGPRPDAQS